MNASTTINDTVIHYLATWNAATDERDELLSAHWTVDATYTDPLAEASGHQSISAVIGAVREQFPGFVFSLVGTPDTHHAHTRFQWGLGPAGEEPHVIGFDVVTVQGDGRIGSVIGFLDRVPG